MGGQIAELQGVIRDLEDKNKKLVASMNSSMYNKAAEFKDRVLGALRRNEDPDRLWKLRDAGAAVNDGVSPIRLQNILHSEPRPIDAVRALVSNTQPQPFAPSATGAPSAPTA